MVAIHRNLGAVGGFHRLEMIKPRKHVADRIGKPGLKGHQRGVEHILGFPAEAFRDQFFQLLDIKMKNLGQQTEDKNVFPLVLGRAAQRLNGQSRDGHTHMDKPLLLGVGLHVVGIIKQDPALAQIVNVFIVTVLIKRHEKIRLIPRGENLARSDADLKNRGPARNGGGDRHVGHDVL